MANPGRYIELLLESVDELEQALLPARKSGRRPAAKKIAAKKAARKKTPAKTTRKKAPAAGRVKAKAVPKNRSSVS
jgi:topoisomerase IA-like protein